MLILWVWSPLPEPILPLHLPFLLRKFNPSFIFSTSRTDKQPSQAILSSSAGPGREEVKPLQEDPKPEPRNSIRTEQLLPCYKRRYKCSDGPIRCKNRNVSLSRREPRVPFPQRRWQGWRGASRVPVSTGHGGSATPEKHSFARDGITGAWEGGPNLCCVATLCLPCQHKEAVKPV